MPIIKQEDGSTLEVGLESIEFADDETPQGFIRSSDHASKLQSEVQRRVASAKRNAKQELLSDDSFWQEVATQRGIELREDDLMPKGAAKDEQAQLERFKAQHLTPIQNELKQTKEQVDRFRTRTLHSELISAAAELGVREGFLKPVTNGAAPPIINMVKDAFVFDQDNEAWTVKSENGVRYNEDGKPFGPKDLIAEMKNTDNYSDLFKSEKMNGSKHTGSSGSPSGRTWTQAEIDSMSLEDYEKNRDDITLAMKEGRIKS